MEHADNAIRDAIANIVAGFVLGAVILGAAALLVAAAAGPISDQEP